MSIEVNKAAIRDGILKTRLAARLLAVAVQEVEEAEGLIGAEVNFGADLTTDMGKALKKFQDGLEAFGLNLLRADETLPNIGEFMHAFEQANDAQLVEQTLARVGADLRQATT
jgi:hypothetical protein